MVQRLYNPGLTLLDQNNASTSGTAGNLLAVPNPDALGATAIQATLPPASAQKLMYYNNAWVFA